MEDIEINISPQPKKSYNQIDIENQQENQQNDDLQKKCREMSNKCLKFTIISIIGLIIGFGIGTLFKHINNFCPWNCPDQSITMTIVSSTLIGSTILIFIILIGGCVFSCCGICCIGIMELGINKNN